MTILFLFLAIISLAAAYALGYSKKLESDMQDGKIVLGGCCIEIGDPKWQCADCDTAFFKDNEDENDL